MCQDSPITGWSSRIKTPVVSTLWSDSKKNRQYGNGWALLLARIYEVLLLLCPQCGGEMKIISFITEGPTIREILGHLGVPTSPPALKPARGPPLWEMPGCGLGETGWPRAIDPQAQPTVDYESDQRIAGGKTDEHTSLVEPGATRAANFHRPGSLRHGPRASRGGFAGSSDSNSQIDFDLYAREIAKLALNSLS